MHSAQNFGANNFVMTTFFGDLGRKLWDGLPWPGLATGSYPCPGRPSGGYPKKKEWGYPPKKNGVPRSFKSDFLWGNPAKKEWGAGRGDVECASLEW